MTEIRSSGTEVTRQCKEIQDKIEITSTKISSSMTSLNELINNKHNDSKLIAKVDHFELPTSKPPFFKDLKKLKKEMNKQHTNDKAEVDALEKKLQQELVNLDKSLRKDLKKAIDASKESKCCCTLS